MPETVASEDSDHHPGPGPGVRRTTIDKENLEKSQFLDPLAAARSLHPHFHFLACQPSPAKKV